ncbi:MAG TPA: DivIVA domain-containing protein [Natronosporangium sp.]
MQDPPQFTLVLRGYQPAAVDALVQQAAEALASGSENGRASARAALLRRDLPVRFRGYDRAQVDQYLNELAANLASG